MNQNIIADLRPPRVDDGPLWDILEGIIGYQAVIVAHELGLFEVLAEKPRTLSEIGQALNMTARPTEVLMIVCTSLGLVKLEENHYALTTLAEDYLLKSSPTSMGAFLDVGMLADPTDFSYDSVKKAFLTDKSQVYGGEEIFQTHEQQTEFARAFTHMMHGHSIGPALAWPEVIDLSSHQVILDIGGGSGAHMFGALRRWSHLNAIIFEMAPVCVVAEEYIAQYGLQSQIQTHTGDLWQDRFPPADVHFYADIYHDWPVEKCRLLTEKSFVSLKSGGRIIIHEMLYNDEKTGPFTVAGYAIAMLLWTEGQQFSGRELSVMLDEAGFVDVEVRPTSGYWHIVTGRKP